MAKYYPFEDFDESKVYIMPMVPNGVKQAHEYDEIITECKIKNDHSCCSIRITAEGFQRKCIVADRFRNLLFSGYVKVKEDKK